jgi:hypothetical protein
LHAGALEQTRTTGRPSILHKEESNGPSRPIDWLPAAACYGSPETVSSANATDFKPNRMNGQNTRKNGNISKEQLADLQREKEQAERRLRLINEALKLCPSLSRPRR